MDLRTRSAEILKCDLNCITDEYRRDCVGGIMALGDFTDDLAIVGAEFIKSCK
jgi:hypothetical protein